MFTRPLLAALAAIGLCGNAGEKSPTSVPVQITVTAAHHLSAQLPIITKDDLVVSERYEALPLTKVIPLTGARAGLELFLLVDECSNCELGPKLDELQRFIRSQAPTTVIGVAYIREGIVQVIENPTADRERAIQALTAPSGSKAANPFGALTDLIKNWPQTSSRRAVLMIANGVNPAAPDEFQNVYAEGAIEAAERAGVIVYAIYHPTADYFKSDFSQIHSGQILLSHVSYETGGEAYFIGPEPLPSLAPFLSDIAEHLQNQYLVEFLIPPGDASGLRSITVKSNIPKMDLMAPDMVWVPSITPLVHPPRRNR